MCARPARCPTWPTRPRSALDPRRAPTRARSWPPSMRRSSGPAATIRRNEFIIGSGRRRAAVPLQGGPAPARRAATRSPWNSPAPTGTTMPRSCGRWSSASRGRCIAPTTRRQRGAPRLRGGDGAGPHGGRRVRRPCPHLRRARPLAATGSTPAAIRSAPSSPRPGWTGRCSTRRNPWVIEPGMVLFAHMILMDSQTETAMCLGRTSLVTRDRRRAARPARSGPGAPVSVQGWRTVTTNGAEVRTMGIGYRAHRASRRPECWPASRPARAAASPAARRPGVPIAVESIDGPPAPVRTAFASELATPRQPAGRNRRHRGGGALPGARLPLDRDRRRTGETSLAFVWDVFDAEKRRAKRLTGSSPIGRPQRLGPWSGSTRRRSPGSPQRAWTRSPGFLSEPKRRSEAVDGSRPRPPRPASRRSSFATPVTAVGERPEFAAPFGRRRIL